MARLGFRDKIGSSDFQEMLRVKPQQNEMEFVNSLAVIDRVNLNIITSKAYVLFVQIQAAFTEIGFPK